MRTRLSLRIAICLLFVYTAIAPPPARASITSDVVWVFVGVALTSAAIGVGIYYLARKGPTLTGCAVLGSAGLQVQNEGDQEFYLLIGDVVSIKPGDRVKVAGKKKKKDASTIMRTFVVEKLSKDYGPCKLVPATP